MFLFYEFFGVVTNLMGGWLGARFGLSTTLLAGLALQILALGMLAVDPAWLTVPYVMVAQGMSGIAKDLTKMSSKSYIKLVVPEGREGQLMRWVSILTGSKNTLKGVGFFLGGALLTLCGFRGAVLGMAGGLVVALLMALALLPRRSSRASADVKLKAVFSRDPRINWLSAARFFLFGSRDVWFVLALPIFLASNLGWSFYEVGGFLALWVIGYGIVQALAPGYVGRSGPPTANRLAHWTAALMAPLCLLVVLLREVADPAPLLVGGLLLFGVIFATNSAIHSYLVVSYAEQDKVSLAVGFYYMANAAGRLVGTILSGALFQAWGMGPTGLIACLVGSMAFVVASRIFCVPLARADRLHAC
jgi:predicted MFS family arabinose efflux permease